MDDQSDGHDPDGSGDERVRSALMNALGVVLLIAVLIAVGTVLVVRALGLNESDSTSESAEVPSEPSQALPTTALPEPEEGASAEEGEEPEGLVSPTQAPKGDLQLHVSPIRAQPGERINLTGQYRGVDNVALQVQRFEAGEWRNFGVQASVRVGVYDTYVMTGRTGEQRFRVWDPQARKGSNVVLVRIG